MKWSQIQDQTGIEPTIYRLAGELVAAELYQRARNYDRICLLMESISPRRDLPSTYRQILKSHICTYDLEIDHSDMKKIVNDFLLTLVTLLACPI